jgi:hypothetical protein
MTWVKTSVSRVQKGTTAKLARHYTNVYRAFAKWANDESLQQAFIASMGHLADEKKLDGRVRHGDGTPTVAKKGERHRVVWLPTSLRGADHHHRQPG